MIEIGYGDQRAAVTESGATLRVYDVGGRPVIEAFDGPEAPATGCQGEILAPWPNRVVDGRWTWDGVEHQLAITEPERGHALHGLVRTLRWDVVEHGADRVELEAVLLAHPGWPFPLHLSASYALGAGGLTSVLTATNVGRTPCPYGVATHPYLAVPGGTVDDAVLRMPAATWLSTDDRLAPVDRRPTAGTPYEFTDETPIGERRADNAFTDLDRLPDGRVEATLTAPDGRTTVMWGDAGVRWWQLFTGDALSPRWRRATLALEPMTCPPDALNSGEDVVVLEPGQSHTLTWGLQLR
ncbi:MAG: aldose 1-epimerase family protein [Actinomycetota bacterium]|nr:aldose 1-epimerase family protein [Actinomycetota bacterium]